jgi:PAS domain S-box-containing protein
VSNPIDSVADSAQARLAAIVDSSDDAIVSKTLDGVITSWNPAAEHMFGYTAAEAVGQHITLIIPHDRLDEEHDVLTQIRRGERIQHFETQRRAKDGRLLDISLTVSPVKDASGRIVGASKIARDITERRQTEQALATTVQRLEVLYRLADTAGRARDVEGVCEAALDAIIGAGADRASVLCFDEGGVMRFRAWHKLSDGYRSAVDGHSPWARDAQAPRPIVVDDVLADDSLGELREVIAAEGIRSLAFIPLVSQGRLLGKFMIYYDSVHAFAEAEMRLAESIAQHVAFGLVRVVADRAVEEHLAREREARREADAANRAKDQFLAVLSHELRTPLNAILGWARMLRSGQLSERERLRALEVIERNTDLQGQMIGDLIDVSRIVAGRMEIEREPVDLVLVARQAIDALAAEVEAKHLRLVIELADAACEVLGDARRLQQVFSNLLSNAIKFTAEGGRIDVRLVRHDTHARVTVTDTGDGIDPSMLSRIFDPFEQADSSSKRKHRGLGLGLAIVRQLVDLHGGTIQAESEGLGKGATFTVDLPVLAVRVGRGTIDETTRGTGSGRRLASCRILIVEDQPDARDLLAFVLTRSGAEVGVAGSGAEALKALAARDFNLLVSDLAMPDVDGYELIRQIRDGLGGGRHIGAVALTAHAGSEARRQALAAGFDACATKPLDADELVGLLERLSAPDR